MIYELVEADTPEEAIENSSYSIGQNVVISRIMVSSAGPKLYSIIPVIALLPNPDLCPVQRKN